MYNYNLASKQIVYLLFVVKIVILLIRHNRQTPCLFTTYIIIPGSFLWQQPIIYAGKVDPHSAQTKLATASNFINLF